MAATPNNSLNPTALSLPFMILVSCDADGGGRVGRRVNSSVMFLLLVISMLVPVSSNAHPAKATAIPTVSLCDVLTNTEAYNDKLIRLRAVFTRGGEDWVAIYCPGCSTDKNLLRPDYNDSFDRLTNRKIRRLFAYPDVTLAVTLVGKLDANHLNFEIVRAERAELISKTQSSPWRLPAVLKRRDPC